MVIPTFFLTFKQMLRLCLEEATKVDVPVVKVLRIFPDTLGRCMAIGNMTWKAITPKAQIELQENFLIEKDRSCKALYQANQHTKGFCLTKLDIYSVRFRD